MKQSLSCPRCGKTYTDFPAISRRDNKTQICSDCGLGEAMLDFALNGKSDTEKKIAYIKELKQWERPILPV